MDYMKNKITADSNSTSTFKLFAGDRALWIIIAVLAILSILVVYSSTAKMAYDARAISSTRSFLINQVAILFISFITLIIVHKINSRIYQICSPYIYILSVILTISVYFIGSSVNGAARWISIFGFQFQPSETLKVATVLILAQQLACRQNIIEKIKIIPSLKFWTWRNSPKQRKIWKEGTFPILMPVVISCCVIFPAHLSSAIIVFSASLVMMIIGRVQYKELIKLILLTIAAGALAMTLNMGRSATAEGRITTWLNLWSTSQIDKPIETLADTERSMIAIHNGGLFGQGAGQSATRAEMIHPESDYAYAFFVEEYGILMAIALLLLYLWIFFRAILIFQQCGTAFPGLIALGLALLITIQALLHIMVTLNLFPETGQPLPLISRGGSSALLTTVALGMILSVSRQNIEKSHHAPKSESILER